MTPDQRHIVTIVEQSHMHLKDLLLRVEERVSEVRGELREVREENREDHAQVMHLVTGLTERVDALEDGDRDDETIAAERSRFRKQILAAILAANAIAATVVSVVAVIVG